MVDPTGYGGVLAILVDVGGSIGRFFGGFSGASSASLSYYTPQSSRYVYSPLETVTVTALRNVEAYGTQSTGGYSPAAFTLGTCAGWAADQMEGGNEWVMENGASESENSDAAEPPQDPTDEAPPAPTDSFDPWDPERDTTGDQKLSNWEIGKLQGAGVDVHEEKGGERTGQRDFYKDQRGNVYIKTKDGSGTTGDFTGININSLYSITD